MKKINFFRMMRTISIITAILLLTTVDNNLSMGVVSVIFFIIAYFYDNGVEQCKKEEQRWIMLNNDLYEREEGDGQSFMSVMDESVHRQNMEIVDAIIYNDFQMRHIKTGLYIEVGQLN